MIPQITKIKEYSVTYLCKEELDILEKEIFRDEIYDIDLKKENPLIYDLGAHIGMSILYFKMKYPESKIVAFEPNPNTFFILEENIENNKLTNVFLNNFALGKKDIDRELYIDNSGNCAFSTSSFTKDAWNGKQKTIPILVESRKMSSFLKENIDLLKIDTEGEELNILEDLDEHQKLDLIENIILEYHPKKASQLKKIISILTRNKFVLSYYFEGQRIEEPIEDLILIQGKKRA